MTTRPPTPLPGYPVMAYHFRVTIADRVPDPLRSRPADQVLLDDPFAADPLLRGRPRAPVGSITAGFAEVTGLRREHETVTYRHGLSFREGEEISKYHLEKYAPITMRRGVFRGAAALYAWVDARAERSLTIDLCDERGEAVIQWRVLRALVKKIDAPAFDAKSGEVAIDALEVLVAGVSVHEVKAAVA